MTAKYAIQSEELRKTYRDGLIRRRKHEALKGVSFTVNRGEIFGLLGPNGAGKTTFIKILLGIIRKSGGAATMLQLPAGSRRGRQMVGYLPENLRIPSYLTALTALEYYGNLSNLPNSQIKQKRDELLDLVGLLGRAKDPVKKFSKGMIQRLGLAQALLHEPELLVLDEPTDGLDPRARAEVRQVLVKLKQRGTTIFLNSHILQEVELVCDRVAILDRGHLRYCGSVKEIGSFIRASSEGDGQSRSELEVAMEVDADESAVRAALDGTPIREVEPAENKRIRIKLTLANQGEVDQCVDRLRKQSISLVSLTRRQITLEDAFLQIVAEPVTE